MLNNCLFFLTSFCRCCLTPQAAIKITGSPQQNLNSTYYRVPGCEIPRHTVTDVDGNELDMPAILACYASYDGPSLYQTEHGNWAVHGSRDAWEVPSVTYMTWDERRNDYGHRRGSSFMWWVRPSALEQLLVTSRELSCSCYPALKFLLPNRSFELYKL